MVLSKAFHEAARANRPFSGGIEPQLLTSLDTAMAIFSLQNAILDGLRDEGGGNSLFA